MSAEDISRVIACIKSLWDHSDKLEIAIEANPADANETKWKAYRDVDVNRLSLGIQSFDSQVLKWLGRDHDDVMAHEAARLGKDVFPSVSLDLIFGHNGQTAKDWERDLKQALIYEPHHISAYQLTVEPGTSFARAESRGQKKAINNDKSAELYEQTCNLLKQKGYAHYEVSNFAKEAHKSQHNLSYWRGYDYVGVGPGAHGRYTKNKQKIATVASLRPNDYVKAVKEFGTGIHEREALSINDHGNEYVMMGLRITDGFSHTHYQEITGHSLPEDVLAQFIQMGFLKQSGDFISATKSGRNVLNTLCQKLLGA